MTTNTRHNTLLCVTPTVQNTSAVGGGPAFDASSLNTSFTTGVAPVQVNLTGPREGRTRCRRTVVLGMATTSAEMVRWVCKKETFVLPYPTRFSSALRRVSGLSGLAMTFFLCYV